MKETPEDLAVVEGRVRAHAQQMHGPSEEFKGRLEMRLAYAWEARKDGGSMQPASWLLRLRLVGTLSLGVVFAAGVTTYVTQVTRTPQAQHDALPEQRSEILQPRARLFESALKAPAAMDMSLGESAPVTTPLQSIQSGMTAAQETSARGPIVGNAWAQFLLLVFVYALIVVVILLIVHTRRRRRI